MIPMICAAKVQKNIKIYKNILYNLWISKKSSNFASFLHKSKIESIYTIIELKKVMKKIFTSISIFVMLMMGVGAATAQTSQSQPMDNYGFLNAPDG